MDYPEIVASQSPRTGFSHDCFPRRLVHATTINKEAGKKEGHSPTLVITPTNTKEQFFPTTDYNRFDSTAEDVELK